MGAELHSLAKKMERAYRNHTGVKLTVQELVVLGELGVFATVQNAKVQELITQCRESLPNMSSAISGSTSAATASPPRSGKSPRIRPSLDQSSIAALSAGL